MNSDLKIRPCHMADMDPVGTLFDAFAALHPSVPYKPGARQIFLNWLQAVCGDADILVLVAELKGAVKGFAVGQIMPNRPMLLPEKIGRIGMFMVESAFRRKGVGRSLYHQLVDWFASKGVSEIHLETEIHNEEAQHFLEAIGFQTAYEQRSIKI